MTATSPRRNRTRAVRSLLCALLVLGMVTATVPPSVLAGPPTTAADTPSAQSHPEILNITVNGSGTATRTNETVFVWAENLTEQNVVVTSRGDPTRELELCLTVYNLNTTSDSNGGSTTQSERFRSCISQPNGTNRSTFDFSGYGEPSPGEKRLRVTLSDGNRTVASANHSMYIVVPEGDADADRLTNAREIELGTDLASSDTDGDGLGDGEEVLDYGTDPTTADTDSDGARDAIEINQGTNATVSDTDSDGLSDGRESDGGSNPLKADTDGDGLSDGQEVFRYGTDPDNKDTDGDGLDDSREVEIGSNPKEVDSDGDGIDDATELQWGTNPTFWFPIWLVGVLMVLLVTVVAALAWLKRDDLLTFLPIESDTEVDSSAPTATETEPAELLSDRERILQVLEENDGQVKQSAIVEETGWSKATVSRKLTAMEEDGEISRFRIGRENVVTRGEEPADRPT